MKGKVTNEAVSSILAGLFVIAAVVRYFNGDRIMASTDMIIATIMVSTYIIINQMKGDNYFI